MNAPFLRNMHLKNGATFSVLNGCIIGIGANGSRHVEGATFLLALVDSGAGVFH